jgi:hypothetical protein
MLTRSLVAIVAVLIAFSLGGLCTWVFISKNPVPGHQTRPWHPILHMPRDCGALAAWLETVAQHSQRSYVLLEALHEKLEHSSCAAAPTSKQEILVVVMCSTDLPARAQELSASWLRWFPRYLVISDGEIAGVDVTVLSTEMVLKIASNIATDNTTTGILSHRRSLQKNDTNYFTANLRQLVSLKWLEHKPDVMKGIKWIFLVDDDTFVNVPFLMRFVQPLPHELPLLVGHMWDAAVWEPIRNISWPSGGAGMLLSRTAYSRIVPKLFTDACHVTRSHNDLTLGLCAPNASVAKVHSQKFKPEPETYRQSPDVYDVGMVVTMHRSVGQMLNYTCLVSKRFAWPHPLCSNWTGACEEACHTGLSAR